MIISKSDYMSYLKHPAWIWLKKHKKSLLPEVSPELQFVFDQGNLFEEYAEETFPEVERLGFENYEEYKTLPERTEEALENGTPVIAQGRFEEDGLTCIVDVLEKNGDKYNLYEIKSSTKVKKEHILDLAFQTVVLEKSGLKLNNISVIHVNKKYERDGEIDPQEHTKVQDITEKVRDLIPETLENIKKAKGIVDQEEMPDLSPRHHNGSKYKEWLTVYLNMQEDLDPYSIYDLYSHKPELIGELEDLGIQSMVNIPEDFDLKSRQTLQVKTTKEDKPHIKEEKIDEFLKSMEYPLYFFDYETLSSVIPPINGIRPYEQVPFQYSLHVLNEPGGEIEHREYIHSDGTNPAEALVKRLKEGMGEEGSIIVWYANFEKRCNNTLARIVPEHEEFLQSLNERIVDLMIPFSNGWYAHKDFYGSASIKKVLPVLVPELSYDNLDITNGQQAQQIWMEAVLNGNGEDKEKIFENLLEYCKLDTLAMVEIMRKLEKMVNDD